MGRRKHQTRSKTTDLFILALLLFLTFLGYNTAPSPYKQIFLFPLVLLALFFIIFLLRMITKRPHPSLSNSKQKLSGRTSRSFAWLLILVLIGGGTYIFWPSVSEI